MNFTTSLVCLNGIPPAALTDLSPVQDPSKIQAAAAVPVDILFASFEKFLKRAWSEHMGPILPHSAIENMQLGLGNIPKAPVLATRAEWAYCRFRKTWRVHQPIQAVTGRYDAAKQESFDSHH